MKKTAKEIEEIKEIVDKAIEWYYEGNGKWAEIIEKVEEITIEQLEKERGHRVKIVK